MQVSFRDLANDRLMIFKGDSLAEISAAWAAYRDGNELGASQCAGGAVVDGRKNRHMSYNGKVWNNRDSWQSKRPLFDPFA